MSISVLILTLNEEANLPRLLASLTWCDDIVVFDSYSSDRTAEIARAAGARVYQRRFDNENDHRTASLQIPFRYRWIYNPDADENPTDALIAEMRAAVANDPQNVAFRGRFKTIFMGKWVKRSSLYPTWVIRLFKPECVSFRRRVNLEYDVNGPVGRLYEHFEHHSFGKGLHEWFDKHNKYSSAEAAEALRSLENDDVRLFDLLSPDATARRKALKAISFRLPFRAVLRFVYGYVLRMGVLDGRAGYQYNALMAAYEGIIELKVHEIRRVRLKSEADARSPARVCHSVHQSK